MQNKQTNKITLQKEYQITGGHVRDAKSIAFSPCGKEFMTCSHDQTIKFWSLDTFECISTIKENQFLWCAKYSPDGKYFAAVRSDQRINLWDRKTKQSICEIKPTTRVPSIEFSRDSKYLIGGCECGTLMIWDLHTKERVFSEQGHGSSILSVVSSHVDDTFVTGSRDRSIKIWDLDNKECIQTLFGHKGSVVSLDYSQDGRYLASASDDYTAKVWDMQTSRSSRCIMTYKDNHRILEAIAISPNSYQLAFGGNEGLLKVYNMSTIKKIFEKDCNQNYIRSIKYSPDGKYIASALSNGELKLWDAKNYEEIPILQDVCQLIGDSIQTTSDGKYFITRCEDSSIKIWENATGKLIQEIEQQRKIFTNFDLFKSSDRILYTCPKSLNIADLKTGEVQQAIQLSNTPKAISLSPTNTQVAYVKDFTKLEVINIGSENQESMSVVDKNLPTATKFSKNGKIIISKGEYFIKFMQQDGKMLKQIYYRKKAISRQKNRKHSIHYDDDDDDDSDDDIDDYIEDFEGKNSIIDNFIISDCGQKLIIFSKDGQFEVWSLKTLKCICRRKGGYCGNIVRSKPNSNLLVTGRVQSNLLTFFKLHSPKSIHREKIPELEYLMNISVSENNIVVNSKQNIINYSMKSQSK